MKAPDIYTELVITNFLENKKKTKKKKAGKATSTGQDFQGSQPHQETRTGPQLCTTRVILSAATELRRYLSHETVKRPVHAAA